MPTLPKKKLQVFVSSTFTDLKAERQEAVSAILKAGHIPAGMELFTAGDQSQLQVVKRWIDDSDIYMLILGTRYGSLEPETQLSYTELEYEYAVSRGKPLFAIVLDHEGIDRKLKELGAGASEAANSAKWTTFRAKVMTKMCSMIDDRRQIEGAIYKSVIDFGNNLDLVGWVPGDVVENTKPLRDRIAALEEENSRLQASLDERRSVVTDAATATATPSSDAFETIYQILQATVPISAEASYNDEAGTRKVGAMLIVNKNLIVKGWIIGNSPSAASKWFEDEIIPTLMIHRLVARETTANGSRRYSATEKGLDFLAWFDEFKLAETSSSPPASVSATQPASTTKRKSRT